MKFMILFVASIFVTAAGIIILTASHGKIPWPWGIPAIIAGVTALITAVKGTK